MTLDEFQHRVGSFSGVAHSELIKLFGWFLHSKAGKDRFDAASLRQCYEDLHLSQPSNLNPYLKQLSEKKTPELLRDNRGYRLEGRVRSVLDELYGQTQRTIAVSNLLLALVPKVASAAEQTFLDEAL